MTNLLGLLLLASTPSVAVLDGHHCKASTSGIVVIDVSSGARATEFTATVFSGAIDLDGNVIMGDASMASVKGKGAALLELPAVQDSEKKLRASGWAIFRSVHIEMGGRLVAAIGVEVDRPGGQCIFVRT